MKKLSAFLFMLLLITAFNACDDGGSSGGGSSSNSVTLLFEVPTNLTGITTIPIDVYTLDKSAAPWHMDQIDRNPGTELAPDPDMDPFDGFPFDTSLGEGNYLEIVDPAVIDAYDAAEELTTEQTCQLFGYRLLCSDGFTSKTSTNPDLSWDWFQEGYLYFGLTPLDNPRAWFPRYGDPAFPGFELPSGTDGGGWNGKYQAKVFAYVQLFRKIDVVYSTTSSLKTLDDYASQDVTYWNADSTAQIKSRAIALTTIFNSTNFPAASGYPADLTTCTFKITTTLGASNADFTDNTITYSQLTKAYITTAKYSDAFSTDIIDELASTGEIIFIKGDLTQQYDSFTHVSQIEIIVPVP